MYLRTGLLQELGSNKDQVPTRFGLPQGLGSLQDCPPSKVRHMYLRIVLLQELGSDKDKPRQGLGSLKDWVLIS